MENKKKTSYESPCLEVTEELDDVLTTSGYKPFVSPDGDDGGWT